MDKQLQDYIQKMREGGFSDDQIKEQLANSGWAKEQIAEFFVSSKPEQVNPVNPVKQDTPIKKPSMDMPKIPRKMMYILSGTFVVLFILILIASTSDDATEDVQDVVQSVQQEVVFDIPSLLGMNAYEIKERMESVHGEPNTFREPGERPLGLEFGTLSWTRDGFMFGFDYLEDGSLVDGTLVFTGFVEFGHQRGTVLQAGNLRARSNLYSIEINPLGETQTINIWVKAVETTQQETHTQPIQEQESTPPTQQETQTQPQPQPEPEPQPEPHPEPEPEPEPAPPPPPPPPPSDSQGVNCIEWCTSSHHTAQYYYHKSCQGWQGLSPTFFKTYNTREELLAAHNRTLHPDCNV